VAKKLSCWVGRHTWATRVTQGETYKVCSACGKTPRGIRKDIEGRAEDQHYAYYDNP
jgi:hypothetical protein